MKNLIIAGIGGQGVNVLTKVLAEVCRSSGLEAQYTIHKGGAQSLGTVYGEMRIASGSLPILGASIPKGKLDILVALDPWEALRHLPLAHSHTQVWVETQLQPLFNDRSVQVEPVSPLDQLHQLPLAINWRYYRRDAIAQYGNAKMANYLAGLDCLHALGINDIKSVLAQLAGNRISL
jgi:Pyruvate/2-oxoacid:ferredoxin oxidoreductase gamma subunit